MRVYTVSLFSAVSEICRQTVLDGVAHIQNFSWIFYIQKLDVQGRARRQATGHCKSEWKVNLGSQNSSRSNGRSHEKVW